METKSEKEDFLTTLLNNSERTIKDLSILQEKKNRSKILKKIEKSKNNFLEEFINYYKNQISEFQKEIKKIDSENQMVFLNLLSSLQFCSEKILGLYSENQILKIKNNFFEKKKKKFLKIILKF